MALKKLIDAEPIFVGSVILKNGKQRMLEFRCDILVRILSPQTLYVMGVDTGSFFMALTENIFSKRFGNFANFQIK